MAEATIDPTVISVEDLPGHRAWLWKRELLRKAAKGFGQGTTYVRVTFTRMAGTTAGAVLIAGSQIGLATRAGWNGAARVATKAAGLVARGVLQVARGVSWVVNKIGQGLSWFVGLFNKKAGENLANANARFTDWRNRSLNGVRDGVDEAVLVSHAAITSPTASAVGRTFAGVVGVAGIANVMTQGAVAAKVAVVAGPGAAMLLGPVGLLATGVVALVGGLFSWLFRKEEVMDRAADIWEADEAKKAAKVAVSEATIDPVVSTEGLTVDLTAAGGAVIRGDADAVAAVMADPEAQREVLRNAKAAQAAAKANGKPDPKLVTNDVIKEALRLEGKAMLNADGEYAKNKMDDMRTRLRNGLHPMPVAEPVSA
jgi:hypothetical protein